METVAAFTDPDVPAPGHRRGAVHADHVRLATTQCKHPAAAVDGGTCQACGTEIW
jgi:hypothetical protein